jgi:hypothetical protein
MTKDIRRIEFYTRKIKELGATHLTIRDARWRRRAIRLQAYKEAMHRSFIVGSVK